MGNTLYPHNEKAYKAVMEAFKTSDRTCIIHPTGTGKSYIVSEVAKKFDKVLVAAPNNFVLQQQKSTLSSHKKATYLTYQWLMRHYMDVSTKYDLIVLDEFHRTGAEEWGAAVSLLLESQPQAKVLGTSATPIRYLDGERDMAKELFNSNIASEMSIAEAWNKGILPIPTYVTGFFSFDSMSNKLKERIRTAQKLKEREKKKRLLRLSNLRLAWEKSAGMPSILKRHINKDSKRIIVFCSYIKNLKAMEGKIRQWFKEAGLDIEEVYTIHSSMHYRQQREQMNGFSDDSGKGIKIMLAVDILNEGIHIPNVNAVIMLRTTSSKVVYLQQMGRCLTAANTNDPIVLDMVDNLDTTSSIGVIKKEFEALERKGFRRDDNKEPRSFEVFDYTLDIRQVMQRLKPGYSLPVEERIAILKKFVEEHGHLPRKKDDCYHHLIYFDVWCPDNEEYRKLNDKYRWKKLINGDKKEDGILKRMRLLEQYYSNQWVPARAYLINRWKTDLKRAYADPKSKYYQSALLLEFFKKHGISSFKRYYSGEERIKLLEDYCAKYGYRPSRLDEYRLSRMLTDLKREKADDSRVQRLLEYPSKKDYMCRTLSIKEVKDFYEKNGRFPKTRKDGLSIYQRWKRLRGKMSNDPEVMALIKLENELKDNKE